MSLHEYIACCGVCAEITVLISATYYDANVPFDKVLEHLDDILLRSGFLEVGSTRTVTFLEEKKRRE